MVADSDGTADGRTLFVNIQHPGEDGDAADFGNNWPASQTGGTGRPRSATVVITKNDGGVVALQPDREGAGRPPAPFSSGLTHWDSTRVKAACDLPARACDNARLPPA